MNDRIKQIIEKSGMKNTEFANTINVHQSYITRMVSGEKNPSSRVIDDICEKIKINGESINKDWLLTGEGNMTIKRTRSQEIGIFANEVMNLPDESIKKRLIEALTKLDSKDWEAIERIADKLLNDSTKEGD